MEFSEALSSMSESSSCKSPFVFLNLSGLRVDGLSGGERSVSPVLGRLIVVQTEVEELLESEEFFSSAADLMAADHMSAACPPTGKKKSVNFCGIEHCEPPLQIALSLAPSREAIAGNKEYLYQWDL